uniref:MAPK kinase substrate protein n=1 Tax=Tamarix hispida TaxID=189793 RepID=A0A4P8FA81_9CARY|nr:MAPK kinase substrate protein [Tamarix hispida]
MEGLQRSQISFRRQGSSGMVWDDKFLNAEIEKVRQEKEAEAAAAAGEDAKGDANKEEKGVELKRSQSDGGRGGSRQTAYRTVKVAETEDPPSPKVAACGFCSFFGKAAAEGNEKKQEEEQRQRQQRKSGGKK